ncbi:26S proteasome non-ATPase regulatory subunit 9 [Choanephora cucurbitarum]|uniref:Probable 26S proteasome regulatory subunit p27 n=1 Tax=Choanephora cucurbitarum TaxID=101091 RepID=A0A1C7NGS5_9FUNG|nr:26S proteasome non-ATPase regulatory subunit 9 [Choanephora cucurbitarum]
MGLMPPAINEPTTPSLEPTIDELMGEAKQLITRKDKIEEELRELEDLLISAGVGMDEPLVDSAGFPRSEIDVHSIRTSRNMIHRLRNDHRSVMTDIEKVLHKIHEAKRNEKQQEEEEEATTSTVAPPTASVVIQEVPVAFAIVNAVAPDSPADSAGLRRNDQIFKFGHINSTNHERLQALYGLISRSENHQVTVSVLREGQTIDIVVTPRSGWGGRGTLGCHLLPL